MKNILEIEEEIKERQQLDANELISKMYAFIPIEKNNSSCSIISAKYCAKVACDLLIEKLPNINDTPPIHRKDESNYKNYWSAVKRKLDNYNVKEAEKNKS